MWVNESYLDKSMQTRNHRSVCVTFAAVLFMGCGSKYRSPLLGRQAPFTEALNPNYPS